MNLKIYKPKVDKLFWILFIPTNAFCIPLTLIPAIKEPQTIFITVPILLFVNYFFASPLCGYVALCDDDLFIKYGFFILLVHRPDGYDRASVHEVLYHG